MTAFGLGPAAPKLKLRLRSEDFSVVTSDQSWELAEGLGLPACGLATGKIPKHAALGALRHIGEEIIVRIALQHGRPLVDIGGNPRRHMEVRPAVYQDMRFVMPDLMPGDAARVAFAKSKATSRAVYCPLKKDTVEQCIRPGGVLCTPMFIHSRYYVDHEVLEQVVALTGVAYSLEHVFDDLAPYTQSEGKFILQTTRVHPATATAPSRTEDARIPQAEYTYSEHSSDEWMIVFKATGNTYSYTHPMPSTGPKLIRSVLARFSHQGKRWLEVVEYTLKEAPAAAPVEDPLQVLVRQHATMLAAKAIGPTTTRDLAYQAARSLRDVDLTAEKHAQYVTALAREHSIRAANVSNAAAEVAGFSWLGRLKVSAVSWFAGTSWSGTRIREALVAQQLDDPLPSREQVILAFKAFLTVLVCMLSFLAWRRRSDIRDRLQLIAGTFLSACRARANKLGAAMTATALFLLSRRAGPGSLLALLTKRAPAPSPHRCAMLTSCYNDPTAGSVICEKGPTFGAAPIGPGLPAQAVVYHTCQRTAVRAFKARVETPYKANQPSRRWMETDPEPQPPVPLKPDEIAWMEQYTGNKKDRKKDGAIQRKINTVRDGFVKKELTSGHMSPDPCPWSQPHATIGDKDPRWVTSCDSTVSALWGPYAVVWNRWNSEFYQGGDNTLLHSSRCVYAVGYTGEELGAFYTQGRDWVSGHGEDVEEFPLDASRFDGTVQEWMNNQQTNVMCDAFGLAKDDPARKAMLADMSVTKLRSEFVVATYKGRRRTGDDVTTAFNTRTQQRFWRCVARLLELELGVGKFRLWFIIGGDDTLVLINASAAKAFKLILKNLRERVGLKNEFSDEQSEFYSCLWVPCAPFLTKFGVSNYLLLPKPGRAWLKSSWCKHQYGQKKLLTWWADTLLANSNCWNSLPVLRRIITNEKHLIGAHSSAKGKELHDLKYHSSADWTASHEVNWDFWTNRYQMSREQIEQFEDMIPTGPAPSSFLLSDHPLVRKLVELDAGFEVEEQVFEIAGKRFLRSNNLPSAQSLNLNPWDYFTIGLAEEAITWCVPNVLKWPTRLAHALVEARTVRETWAWPFKLSFFAALELSRAVHPSLPFVLHAVWNYWIVKKSNERYAGALGGPLALSIKERLAMTKTNKSNLNKKNQNSVASSKAQPTQPQLKIPRAVARPISVGNLAQRAADLAHRVAGTANPSFDCHAEARTHPRGSTQRCQSAGGSLASARNPLGVRESQVKEITYQLPVVASAGGEFAFRVCPTFVNMVSAFRGTVAASSSVTSAPDFSAVDAAADTYRMIGWEVAVSCDEPAMTNGGTISAAREKPSDPGVRPWTEPGITPAYVQNLPGRITTPFKNGVDVVGALGSAQYIVTYTPVDETERNDVISYDTSMYYSEVDADPWTTIGDSAPVNGLLLGSLMDSIIVLGQGLEPSAAGTVFITFVYEATVKSNYSQYSDVPNAPALVPLKGGQQYLESAAHAASVAAQAAGGVWKVVKMATNAAGMVPGLADAAAVAKDVEAGVDTGAGVAKTALRAASSLWHALHG